MATECANPLLLGWLKEWLDFAKEHNTKGFSTYKKAYESMRLCPLQFDHPSQAQALNGIGPKLCDRLTEKLRLYCEGNGLPMPADPRKAKKRAKATASKDQAGPDTTAASDAAAAAAEDEEEEEETPAPPPPKRPRKTKPKQYVPALRTGAYAIMLALATLPENAAGGMTKAHIIELAQPHCDASFTAPPDPSKFYTAWNSMKTLMTKELVYQSGGARKVYCLTDEGWETAKRVKEVSGLSNEAIRDPDGAVAAQNNGSKVTSTQAPVPTLAPAQVPAPAPAPAPVQREQHVFREPPSSQPVPETSKRAKGKQRISFVDLDELIAEEDMALPPPAQTLPSNKPTGSAQPKPSAKTSGLSRSYTDTDFVEILSSSPKLLPEKPADRRSPLNVSDVRSLNKAPSPSIPAAASSKPALGEVSESRVPASAPSAAIPADADSPPFPAFTPILIPPSAYTVTLLLDNREVRSKSDRDYIQSGLLSHGVRALTRSLPVGDALWVARLNDNDNNNDNTTNNNSTLLTSAGEEGTEIVLEHILERKRLDDLITSIKDGRFAEQKFRLRRSGASSVVYLVEEYDVGAETREHYREHVCSAVAGSMVVGGLFVKRTRSLDESIAYLARMTKLLAERYAGRTLSVVPARVLDEEGAPPLPLFRQEAERRAGEAVFVTYEAFSNLSGKSEALTLRDVFLKMLMCVRGVTGEKALAVQAVWPTPADFVQAYRASGQADKADLVYKRLGNAVGRKKIGKALSRKIAEVWGGGTE